MGLSVLADHADANDKLSCAIGSTDAICSVPSLLLLLSARTPSFHRWKLSGPMERTQMETDNCKAPEMGVLTTKMGGGGGGCVRVWWGARRNVVVAEPPGWDLN